MGGRITLERLLAGAVFAVAALADGPANLHLGPMSGLACLSIGLFLLGAMSVMAVPTGHAGSKATRPLVLFFAWAAGAALFNHPTGSGVQNLTVLGAFGAIILATAGEAGRDPSLGPAVVHYGRRMVAAASVLYLTSMGVTSWMGARTYALVALLGVACVLATNRPGERMTRTRALLVVGLIGLSLSRLALGLAVLLMFVARPRRRPSRRTLMRTVASVALAGVAMVFLINQVPALHERFFSGDQSIGVGSVRIDAAGRTNFWEKTVDSWQESPWTGHGAGSASALIETHFPGLGHPHNEYLRLLHDYGLVGAVLFVWGLLSLLVGAWKRWHADDGTSGGIHQAAALGLLVMLLAMLTDNVIVYVFFMAPLATLVGTSLGSVPPPVPPPAPPVAEEAARALPVRR